MGYHDARLGSGAMVSMTVEAEVRHAYQTARQTEGLRGRAAFAYACHIYANRCPEVYDHRVPQRVAEILNPSLRLAQTGSKACRPILN